MTLTRMTFAVGTIGPCSDGDAGTYVLKSLVREHPSQDIFHPNYSARDWAEARMLEQLEKEGRVLGQDIAFVAFLGNEDLDESDCVDCPEVGFSPAQEADMEWTIHRITDELQHTQAPGPNVSSASVLEPLAYSFEHNQAGLNITLMDAQGQEAATVFIEIGSDGKTPVLRVWDGENGTGHDPIINRPFLMEEAE